MLREVKSIPQGHTGNKWQSGLELMAGGSESSAHSILLHVQGSLLEDRAGPQPCSMFWLLGTPGGGGPAWLSLFIGPETVGPGGGRP